MSGWACAVALLLAGSGAAQAVAANESGIPVLAYHRFDRVAPAATTVTVATFESQLDWLAGHGYKVVPLQEIVDVVARKAAPPGSLVTAITVDDGHESVYRVLFPMVKQRKIPVTLFIYPSAISNAKYAMTWDELREMKASGLVDIEAHTYWHPNFKREKKRLDAKAYAALVDTQLTKSRAKLDAQLGTHMTTMAWPYGIVDAELEAAAARAGYVAAFGYAGGVARPGDDVFSIHRIPVPNYAHGNSFGGLLRDAQAHPNGNESGSIHE